MLKRLFSATEIEAILMKLTMKQKQFVYQIARLEYRIFKNMLKADEVNSLILEEEYTLKSLNDTIKAAGEGKVKEKLNAWKVKSEYKLFKLNLRKNKIDIPKLIIDQSKLEQIKNSLKSLNADIAEIKSQNMIIKSNNKNNNAKYNNEESVCMREIDEHNSMSQSINDYLKEVLKMAS